MLSVVIPVRNDASRLRRCLAAIAANPRARDVEVLVADNGSIDDSAAVATAAGASVVPVPGSNVGEARNAAAARAHGDLIAFVDADHLIDPGWIAAVADVFADSRVIAAGAPYQIPAEANWVQRAYHRLRPRVSGRVETEWLGSGNLIVRRAAFEAVGGFDAGLQSCEDVDLCNRLRRAGCRLIADERLRSVHLGDPATIRALFFGELWRGRDNIAVTLRGPLAAGALPSVLIPVIDLAALASLVFIPWAGAAVAIASGTAFFGFASLRAFRMTMRDAGAGPRAAVQNMIVAVVYDAARALALVARATHRTRRETAGEGALA